MKRKLLLTFVMFVAGIIMANAQCTPGTCGVLICPDTNTNLPRVYSLGLYTTTMTVKVPLDTTISTYTATVDSLNYTSVAGLPYGFTMTPNKTGWAGGTKGCVQISGTPADSMRGKKYKLQITVTAHGKYMSIPVSDPLVLYGYKIIIDSALGISNYDLNKFTLDQNIPNPFSTTTTIFFTSQTPEHFDFIVYNVIGETIYSKEINAVKGENKIVFSSANLPSGIYMYKLNNETQTITKRMIVEGK